MLNLQLHSTEPSITFNNPLLALQAAKNGLGIALSNIFLSSMAIETGNIKKPFSAEIKSGAHYFLVMPNDIATLKKMRLFKQ